MLRIKGMQTLAHQWGKLALVTFEQRTRSGQWRERAREIYDNGNSAAILPYDPQRGTVLLTRQLRLPTYLQDGLESSIEACAGKLDGETAERRIIEEMDEELGYRIAKVERLFELSSAPARSWRRSRFLPAPTHPRTKYPREADCQRRARILRCWRQHWNRPPR
jgi:nudix-type nucleoside diphosphatase (YffH/AdpP family)